MLVDNILNGSYTSSFAIGREMGAEEAVVARLVIVSDACKVVVELKRIVSHFCK